MTVLVYTAHISPEHVSAVEAAGRRVFAAVHAARPEGFRYAVARLGDATYVTLLEIPDGGRNPLRDIPEYTAFEAALPGWLAEPSTGGPGTLIGSYRVFDPAG
jgi:hypothetical protein